MYISDQVVICYLAMPKKTFLKLSKTKRDFLTNGFLREFALKSFDEASITSIVKTLGIAKGSIYQYFDGKLDLFLYLSQQCGAVKGTYIAHIVRQDYPDFWEYYRALYSEGVKFDLEHPLESHFLHNLADNLNSPSVKPLYEQFLDQAVMAFEKMVTYEVGLGQFRNDIPTKTMGFFLYQSSLAINDQIKANHGLNPAARISADASFYEGKVELLMQTVEEYIGLLKKALDK